MGFRCSLCCLVKGCRPTWLSGKELAGGCVRVLRYVQVGCKTSKADP